MTEYLLAIIIVAIVMGASFKFLFDALRSYYRIFSFLMGLPVP